jgi:Family of unknown function (DUF6600)/FecR protein
VQKEKSMNLRAIPVVTRVLAAVCALAAVAVASPVASAQEDLPGRVGRVANVAGELFIAPEAQPDAWTPAGLNFPVAGGDNLWVGNDGRAEVDVGGTQVRLAGDSNLHVSRLDDRQFALFVAQGRVSIRVRVLEGGELARVDTPNAQVTITRPGLYRVDVSPDREHTHIVVREGEVNVQTAGALQQVLPGQSANVDGANPQYATVQNGIGIDGFDTWVADRDRYYRVSASGNYVSRQMVGAADLAQYGSWTQNQEYGAVWYPNDVPVDWAPYRNGYWTEVGAWGPTWVDYAPWGYAPFHYGRWAYVNGRWGWCPGAYVARPLWAPALVAWTGGTGWGVSASVGGAVYGWVPLAWGEPYRPWWGRCSHGCWDRYNRPYAVNVAVWRPNSPPPTSYRNWNAPNAVTAVRGSTLYARQPVQQNLVRVSREQFATAPVLSTAPPVSGERTYRGQMQRPTNAPPPASSFQQAYSRPAQVPVNPASPGTMRQATPQQYSSPSTANVPPRAPTQATPSQPMQREDLRRSPSYAQPTPPSQPPSHGQSQTRVAQPQQQMPQQPVQVQPSPPREAQLQRQPHSQPPQVQPSPPREAQLQRQPQSPPPQMQPQQAVRVQQPQMQQPTPPQQASRQAPPPMQQAAPQPVPHATPPPKPAQDSGNHGQRGEPKPRDTPPGQDGSSGGGNMQRQSR